MPKHPTPAKLYDVKITKAYTGQILARSRAEAITMMEAWINTDHPTEASKTATAKAVRDATPEEAAFFDDDVDGVSPDEDDELF